MKIVSAFFTKQCSGIAEELNSSQQVIPHLGAKLKGFTKSEGGVTRGPFHHPISHKSLPGVN